MLTLNHVTVPEVEHQPKRDSWSLSLVFTRVTLVTKGLYVGCMAVKTLFVDFRPRNSYFAARRCFKALIKQRALRVACGQRCRQDEARADFARDDDLSKVIDRDGFCALHGRSCLPRACTTGEDERLRSQITSPLMRACTLIW